MDSFVCEISISDYDTNEQLAFKIDGNRFEGASRTLKYSTDRTYLLKFVTKPAMSIMQVNVNGSDIELKSEKIGEYSGPWNTEGSELSKRGTRKPLIILIKFDTGQLRAEFQSKTYAKNDSHAVWGHKLAYIELKCANNDGIINIVDENFR